MPSFENISRNPVFLSCMFCFLICFIRRVNSLYFIGFDCGNFTYSSNTTNSPYRTSLNFLFSTLFSNASRSNGYYNSTVVAGNDPSNTIYGLFLCRGDLSVDVCEQCVDAASGRIIQDCPSQKSAIVWYEECWLRYSNQYIFSGWDENDFGLTLYNPSNVTEPARFKGLLENLMYKIKYEAAKDRSSKKFAVAEDNFSSFHRLYTLAQCTPDLSILDCDSCLSKAITNLHDFSVENQGARISFSSCSIRYEVYRFYNISVVAPATGPTPNPLPPPLPPSVPTTSGSKGKRRISKQAVTGIILSITFSLMLFVATVVLLKRRSRKRYEAAVLEENDGAEGLNIDPESLQFSLSAIQTATNNFSVDNKIGQGGFGPVYKGTLPDGQDIAVKRLSRNSGQGAEEFKNEIAVVAKLQHRNLVRLLGFCLEGREKMLVYEFVPNKSLDYFLFDPEKQQLLDWSRRYKIIGGIAKGLLYLHEDSRLRIVHRDLKAGNILLDESMNPKIADFGMAKICGSDEFEGNTNRIAGTFGYMAPEYTTSGQFSVKSDVFSFGVVILEIIVGKKNSNFYQSEDGRDLLSYAWEQWRNGTPLALLDPTIRNSCVENEVLKCIHVGLLCVEEDTNRRPMMASVVYMLSGDSVTLPTPQLPGVSQHEKSKSIPEGLESDRSTTNLLSRIMNDPSSAELQPR